MDTQDIEELKKQNAELLLALREAAAALENSQPIMHHYIEPNQRHNKAYHAVLDAIAAAETSAAQSAPASAPEAGYLVVGTLVEEGVVTVYVHLKEGDSTIVLYLKNHALNGETIGIMPLPVGVVDRIRTPAVGAVQQDQRGMTATEMQ